MSKAEDLRRMREAKYRPDPTPRGQLARSALLEGRPDMNPVTAAVTPVTSEVTHQCSVCGEMHSRKLTPAEKQKAYRERKRNG